VKRFTLKVDIGLLAISDRLYDPVCAGLTDDQLAFLWVLLVLLYWQIYSYIHMRQNLFRDCYGIITKKLAMSFNHTFRCIADVLTICPLDISRWTLKIKDTTESDKSASYLDILLNIDSNGELTTTLFDKRDFDFTIVNFPLLCSNIPLSPAYGVYVSQLIPYVRSCFAYEDFSKRGKLRTKKLMLHGYNESRLKSSFRKFYGHYNDLLCDY
jgi:hypothetical protein